MPNKSSTKDQNIFKQAAEQLDIPVIAVYGALLMVVAITSGVVLSSQASTQNQDLRSRAANYVVVGCNQACTNNRNCEPNHFCYRGRCRLASNPERESCDLASPTVDHDLKGGDINSNQTDGSNDQAATSSGSTEATETEANNELDLTEGTSDQIESYGLLDQLMGEDNSQLFLVLGLGAIGLLVIVALITILSSSKNKSKDNEVNPPDFSNLEKK